MAQLSRRWMKPDVEAKVQNLLVECIERCSSQQEASNFVDVLLTKTEKTMIAKRIAIALMLIKGYSAPEIDERLKVSQATVYTVKAWLEDKGREYRTILESIARRDEKQKEERQALIGEAQSFFPLRPGTNWSETRKKQWEQVRKTKAPF